MKTFGTCNFLYMVELKTNPVGDYTKIWTLGKIPSDLSNKLLTDMLLTEDNVMRLANDINEEP